MGEKQCKGRKIELLLLEEQVNDLEKTQYFSALDQKLKAEPLAFKNNTT